MNICIRKKYRYIYIHILYILDCWLQTQRKIEICRAEPVQHEAAILFEYRVVFPNRGVGGAPLQRRRRRRRGASTSTGDRRRKDSTIKTGGVPWQAGGAAACSASDRRVTPQYHSYIVQSHVAGKTPRRAAGANRWEEKEELYRTASARVTNLFSFVWFFL